METSHKSATIMRDNDKNIIIDNDGQITCVCDDGLTFKISTNQINFECNILRCEVDGIEIDVALSCDGSNETNSQSIQDTTVDAPTEDKPTNFGWTDASTKLLLSLYKEKKDLVTSRRIKTHKLMWKQISEEMSKLGYQASPIQVENKFKTMERAFKKTVSVNNKTGRGRTTCSFYSELTELLAGKHSIAPLAVSGRAGLMVRADALSSENTQAPLTSDRPSMSTDTIEEDAPSTQIHMVRESYSTTTSSSTNTNHGELRRTVQMGSTAKSLVQCKKAIEDLTAEIKEQRTTREKVQFQILEEQKRIVKLHEELIETAKEQRAFANQQRDEKNKLLQQILQLLQSEKNHL